MSPTKPSGGRGRTGAGAPRSAAAPAPPSRARKPREEDRRSLGRLERILILVPYCVRHPGVSVDELAAVFGTTADEILDDLNLIFLCGLPDYTPADLMDVSWEGGRVWIRMADYFSRPLRITRSEAIPLYVRARALLDLFAAKDGDPGAGIDELAPLRSALDKLGRALSPQDGGVPALGERIRVQLEAGEATWLPVLRDAVRRHRRVEMEYFTRSRDTITQRRLDPYLVFSSFGHWYVSGYCHLAQDRRVFRLDRIKAVHEVGESFEPPDDAAADLPPPLLYVPGPEDAVVKLRASGPVAAWFEAYHPLESARDLPRGWRELEFRTAAFPWLEKLLLRLGSEVVVVEPRELQERLATAARRVLGLYTKRG